MSLNQSTLDFIKDFEKQVHLGTNYTRDELVEKFENSSYFHDSFQEYRSYACPKAIGYAIKRSGKWIMNRGVYTKKEDGILQNKEEIKCDKIHQENLTKENETEFNRLDYIKYLSKSLYSSFILKNQLQDEVLRTYHFGSKAIGDELYYVTTAYFREKGLSTNKYKMADFISLKAKELMDSGVPLQGKLRYEHMVPKNMYFEKIKEILFAGNLTEELVYEYMSKYYYTCTVTKEEDDILLTTEMPGNWDEANPFYRYEYAGIEFVSNLIKLN
ncbi:hypothetical protein ACWKTZ_21925 [Bacillus cereus]